MKKILSVLLTLALVVSVFLSMIIETSAASTMKTKNEALAWLNSQQDKTYDFDGAYGTQCTEFVKAYVNYIMTGNPWTDCGYNVYYHGGDVWKSSFWESNGWKVYENTYDFVPQPGDIFCAGLSSYGHTGVVISSDIYNATIAEANGRDSIIDNGDPVWIRTIPWKSSTTDSPYGATHFIRPNFNTATASLVTPTISFNKSSYTLGDTITFSWKTSPSNSNLSHYWVTITNPDGNTYADKSIDKSKSSYSFTPSKTGTYTVKMYATPVGSQAGEGSLTDVKKVTVNTQSIPYVTIPKANYFIKNKANGLYLNVAYGVDANETVIHVCEFGNYDSQVYNIYGVSGGYEMMPLSSKTRVVNPYCSTVESGKPVNLYEKTNKNSQWWKFQSFSDGYVIRNVQNPNVCLTFNSSGLVVSTYTGSSDQIWYLEKACTVKYDGNGGSGAPASQRVRAGYKTVLSAQKPTRNGYTFLGWSTAKNATTASWNEKASVTIYADITLYAVWKKNACSHTYSNNCDASCNVCKATRTPPHSYKTSITKATTSKNGKITKTCSGCKKKVTSTIYYAKSFSLSKTSFTYNGKVQTPTITVKDAKGKVIDPKYYTLSYSSGRKNVGTYKVTIKLKGNYSGSKTLSYKINPISISKCKVSISGTSYTYNGKTIKPSVKVLSAGGSTLKNGTHYTVTYSKGCKAPGTYKVTVKMKGTYSGSKSFTYKINPISISKCKVSISGTSYYYDGKTKTPSVKVLSAGGSTLKNGTHYTVSYSSGRKNVGTYKVTVKMKGTYSGSKTFTFKIIPPKTSISKITADINTMKVYITKKSTQVTGYEIQYASTSDFTDALTMTIADYNTTSATITEFKAGATCYVRVRTYKTVSGVKYYSGWSTVKVITTKPAPIVEQ